MDGIKVSVTSDFKSVSMQLSAFPKEIRAAAASALHRAAKTSETHTRRRLAKAVKVPLRAVKGRVNATKAGPTYRLLSAAVYVHHKPLIAAKVGLGKPRQTKKGVNIGRRQFPGHFFIPKGHTSKKTGTTFKTDLVLRRKSRARNAKLEDAKIELHPMGPRIAKKVVETIGRSVFQKRFKHELKRRFSK